ncbi:MAG: hypothetical protein UT79_C0008G0002 [Candidatus Moranbacteria bacterium GW2011_GWC2_40_12]|nr:MAG: hypothetical protein UT79_C0008G0002 [Candidatus Moranbacteria bacterium GW2011_GWC2_40_12]
MRNRIRAALAVIYLVLLVLIVYAIQPATASIGSERVYIGERVITAAFKNLVGDFLGYGRCNITGMTLYRTPIDGLMYTPTRGVLFNSYAIEALLKMRNQEEAYRIAQKAFDQLQESGWSGDTGHKLYYPLRRLQ